MEEKRKRGIVDSVNDAVSTYQNARALQGLARAASVISRGALVSTSAVWAPILIALGAVVFFVVVILILSGGKATGTETVAQSPSPATPQNIEGILNINGATEKEKEIIGRAFSLAAAYPSYKNIFSSAGVVGVTFVRDLRYENSFVNGLVGDGNEIKIRSGLDEKMLIYTFLHETGHIIAFRSPNLLFSFPHGSLRNQDQKCYSAYGYLISYPFKDGGGGVPSVESFSEGISQFLIYGQRDVLQNFPTECPATYSWFRENVFGQ